MLLLAFGAVEDGENRHTESMPDEMGCPVFTRNRSQTTISLDWKKQSVPRQGMKHMGSPLHILRSDLELAFTLGSEENGSNQKQRDSLQYRSCWKKWIY